MASSTSTEITVELRRVELRWFGIRIGRWFLGVVREHRVAIHARNETQREEDQ